MHQKVTKFRESLVHIKYKILTYVADLCPLCHGHAWLGYNQCNCDPCGEYKCYGIGSCGMIECPLCNKLNIQHALWELSPPKVQNYIEERALRHVSET